MDNRITRRHASGGRKWGLVFGVTAVFFFSLGLVSCRGVDWFLLKRSLRAKFSEVHWITTQQLADWLADKNRAQPVLLDVRTPAEWNVSHLAGARQVDPKADAKTAAEGLPKDTPIVTYCSIGYRSGEVARRLQKAGYSNVQDLEGSIFEWGNEQRPLVHDGKRVTKVHPYSATWGRLLEPGVRGLLPPADGH
ncbi:MAG: rhodanese-like domain-containing protein [Chthoniobacterales bacterium]